MMTAKRMAKAPMIMIKVKAIWFPTYRLRCARVLDDANASQIPIPPLPFRLCQGRIAVGPAMIP
jgi:hypothetical protein